MTVCAVYLIIFTVLYCVVFSLVYGPAFHDKWYMTRYFTITLSAVVVILPLCFPRRIDFLKYARYFAENLNIMISYCLCKDHNSVKSCLGMDNNSNDVWWWGWRWWNVVQWLVALIIQLWYGPSFWDAVAYIGNITNISRLFYILQEGNHVRILEHCLND